MKRIVKLQKWQSEWTNNKTLQICRDDFMWNTIKYITFTEKNYKMHFA